MGQSRACWSPGVGARGARARVCLTQVELGRARGLPAPPPGGSQSDSSLEAGVSGTLLGAALRVTYVPETQ